MFFVCGVHGVGKTQFCKKMAERNNMKTVSASQLIKNKKKEINKNKRVKNILDNQKILINEVNKIQKKDGDFILDGHLCLINENDEIKKLPVEVFRSLNINELIVLVDSSRLIKERLEKRDRIKWNEEFITKFQNKEIEYARKIASELKIDLEIITLSKKKIAEPIFSKDIILPIKPLFAEEILNCTKKYEYRSQLCAENIDKIYLYATTPVKKIVGEAEVLAKLSMRKDHLWSLTQKEAGIEKKYFDEYFSKSEIANAYVLGEVVRYKNGILLKDKKIFFNPQSYVYI